MLLFIFVFSVAKNLNIKNRPANQLLCYPGSKILNYFSIFLFNYLSLSERFRLRNALKYIVFKIYFADFGPFFLSFSPYSIMHLAFVSVFSNFLLDDILKLHISENIICTTIK